MHLTLDVDQLRSAMDLWRVTLGMRGAPVAGENRREILEHLCGTVSGWLNMLCACTANDTEAERLEHLRVEVRELHEWAQEARYALRILEDDWGVRMKVKGQ